MSSRLPALALLLVLCAPAWGAAPGMDVEIARAHFRTAQQYYQRDRFLDAAREFQEAYRLSRKAEILYNIGKSYDGARDLVRARDYYRKYMMALPESGDSNEVSRRVMELSALIAHVVIVSSVEGAAVWLDGQSVGTTPLAGALEINPGKHKLEVAREGWKRFSEQLEPAPSERLRLEVNLQPLENQRLVLIERREKPADKTPVYKKWWLWTTIGLIVAGGAVAGGVLGARAAGSSGEIESPVPVAR
jgi:tetratricopeptide (TPR) repeat protein